MILCGEMRTYDFITIIDSYNQYLSSYGIIDLYIFTWKKKGYSNHHGNTNIHEKQNDIMQEEDIIKHYSQFPFFSIQKIIIDDFEEFYNNLTVSMKNIYNTPFHDHSKITTSIPIEYKYQQAINWLSNVDVSYSNVMITRPDMQLKCVIPMIDPIHDIIYFKHICNRCMDHLWIGTQATIIKQLHNIFDNYELNCHHCDRDNNELLIHQCKINNIQINAIHGICVKQQFF